MENITEIREKLAELIRTVGVSDSINHLADAIRQVSIDEEYSHADDIEQTVTKLVRVADRLAHETGL